MLRKNNSLTKSGPELGIKLDDPAAVFGPGDHISGVVHREKNLHTAMAVVSVTLSGTLEVYAQVPHAQGGCSSTMRVLQTSEDIYTGPIIIRDEEPGRREWRFDIQVPTSPSHESVAETMPIGASKLLLPTDKDSVSTQKLPPTCHTKKKDFFVGVQYILGARLTWTEGTADVTHAVTAQKPVPLHNVYPGPPVQDSAPTQQVYKRKICTQRLAPEMRDAELTTGQKCKKMLHLRSVPRFSLKLLVNVPTVIQISHPDAIPLTIRAVPDWECTSDCLAEVVQKAKLVEFRAVLVCECNLAPGFQCLTCSREKYALQDNLRNNPDQSIEMVCTDTEEPLNLGSWVDLRLKHPELLVPSLTTYTMRVTHQLKYKMQWEIGGESIHISGKTPVQLLPASRPADDGRTQLPGKYDPSAHTETSASNAPPAIDAPPTFEEVQRQTPPSFDQVQEEMEQERLELAARGGAFTSM